MKIRSMPDGSVLFYEDLVATQMHDFGNGVVLHVTRGIPDGRLVHHVIADGEKQIKNHGRVFYMSDAAESKMATAEFRDQLGEWFRQNSGKAVAHVLFK